jgi:protein phosphatase
MNLSEALQIVAQTDPGMIRPQNEDSVLANPVHGLVVLADGMGGYNAGEVASGMATAMLGTELEKAFARRPDDGKTDEGKPWAHATLQTEIARTNAAIYQAAQSQPQYAGMGTTLVMGLFHDNMLTAAHIGDSRLYRLRGEEFKQLSRDHSMLQEQIDSGMLTPEEARYSQNKNLVTRALGVDPTVEPEIRDYEVQPGDIYLFCSDGLNDMVEDSEIAMTLSALAANPTLCASQLIQMANDNGGRDNVSVIVVKVTGDFGVARGVRSWLARLLAWLK